MKHDRRSQRSDRIALLRFVARQENGVAYDRNAPHHVWMLKHGYVTSKIHQPDKEVWPEARLYINDLGREAIAAADAHPVAA